MAYFTNRGINRADFPSVFSYPLASPPNPQKQYPAHQDFSTFQEPEVICEEFFLLLGANRAHFKSFKPVILLKNPRK
jgi:hypothetical protein